MAAPERVRHGWCTSAESLGRKKRWDPTASTRFIYIRSAKATKIKLSCLKYPEPTTPRPSTIAMNRIYSSHIHVWQAGWIVGLLFASRLGVAAEIDFNRDVRPILSDYCYACHGPDQEQRQADLRLDTQEGALTDLGGYAAITPGNLEQSELIRRIFARDDEAMPPPDHPKQLNESQKATLRAWIEQGAYWKTHWAYEKPIRIPTPSILRTDDADNWIDAFVLHELEKRDIAPARRSDPITLLRRLSFDLIGLPPTPEEADAFVANDSDTRYEATVDRLMGSPHFGERLAMVWLDLVRYADSVGYHGDQDVSVSPFRDYVISAFNDNLPFDQFTREQLAGDLLESPTQRELVASGYNKLGMMSAEGGVQPEEYLAKYAADRVRNASTVWLGSTLGCAECHNHKFDPFTTQDFYRFAAYFADIKERGLYSGANRDGNWGPTVDVADIELGALLKPFNVRFASRKLELDEATQKLRKERLAWETRLAEELGRWQTIQPETATALHGTELEIQSDRSVLARGNSPPQNTYTLTWEHGNAPIGALRVEVHPEASLPGQGPGRAGNGNFVISEVRLFLEGQNREWIPHPWSAAYASIEQTAGKENPHGKWSAASAIDNDAQGSTWGWAILPETGKAQVLQLQLAKAVRSSRFRLVIEQNHTNPKHTLGHFRISTSPLLESPIEANESETSAAIWQVPEAIRTQVTIPQEDRTESQQQALTQYFQSVAPALKPLRESLQEAEDQRKQLIEEHTRSTLITVAVAPREMRVLHRGNWMDKSGEVVRPGIPQFLAQMDTGSSLDENSRATRLDLANWLVSRSNPLTARVFVNRLWKLFFGTGLSKVMDDLGSQGQAPSHPELLDALAVEFMESGWNIKHIVKLMVMSRTYKQSSRPLDAVAKADPYNRLLARQSRFRLDAELIRDNALAISGLLVPKVGGRSVKPYQPTGLYQHLNFPTRVYQHDTGVNQYRRGVYTHWQRQFLHPAMQAFDAPSREECTAERPLSNTPLAALVLLNDPSYVEASRKFAELTLRQPGLDSSSRIHWMMKRALSRRAQDREVSVLEKLLESERSHFTQHRQAAEQLTTVGLSDTSEAIEIPELAAWTMVARAILNMHETVTRN